VTDPARRLVNIPCYYYYSMADPVSEHLDPADNAQRGGQNHSTVATRPVVHFRALGGNPHSAARGVLGVQSHRC